MRAPHEVLPSDEGRHEPDAEDLWNESYYCDFVSADGTLGGWLRLGLYPNREVAWWTTWIVRPRTEHSPGAPGICSVDYRAPVPPGDTLVSESPLRDRSGGRIEIDLRRPLEEFRLAAHVPATVVADPADVYTKGEHDAGPAADLDLDLTWTTDGSAYHYELTTRYEIPCLVSGTVTIDGETFTVDGQGQRDHSWGVRDWWAFGWCWCSMRLDDGTRVHLADIRIPDMPVFFGYIQTPGKVNPVTALSVTEAVGEDGFPTSARIQIAAAPEHDIGLEVTPLAFGPVLLRDDNPAPGTEPRTSRFPRALVSCRADDGRTGAGWIEWNQPEPPAA
ncbi:MAG TPA: hypothetical protein VMF35_06840 [Acidimicrobiales bacterium]|nr:hypothetical protein [Acidimicrobiales bacterium]